MILTSTTMRTLCHITAAALLLAAAPSPAQQPGTVRWKTPIGNNTFSPSDGPISSPAVGADGTIYVGSGFFWTSGGITGLYAISPQGRTNWIFTAGGAVRCSPAIGPDGTIYVTSLDGNLYSVSPAGRTNWVFRTSAQYLSSPALGADGNIYVFVNNFAGNKLYSARPDGKTNWIFRMGTGSSARPAQFPAPAIGPDGTIYSGALDTNVYAIRPNGLTNWMFPLGAATYSSPALGPDGTIFIGSDDNKLHALSPGGVQKWEFLTGSQVESSPTVDTDGRVYISSLDQHLYALNANGVPLWTNTGYSSSPAVAADGTVYSETGPGSTILAMSRTGSNLWSVGWSGFGFSSPAIGPDGTVYVAGGPYLWAIYGSSPLAQSSWPMFRRNTSRTARSIQCAIFPPSILSNGTATLTCRVETGRVYRVSASSDLATWTGLGTFTSNTNLTQFQDFAAPNYPQRFYRLATP
jgi:outer membrane protein assembly factor BamB